MLYTVIDHDTKELNDPPTPPDHYHVPAEKCSSLPTPDPAATPSSSTVAHYGDDCNEVAIIVPIVSVIIAAVVIICIVIFVTSYCWKREKNNYTSRKR